ncbi:hypothetical protein BGW36DRAFT_18924 [Talaromyces proteolyticus]|uniref:Uncharacterized protein n=1 Tax=Talaromyces proteolyticus TaxID=1131652 RepID=A0AAD4L778_9EURO|nr:uncharacterized protein BGW36DRAFT_18924 [Talaromyces proteolyticus]KAH8705860.1 hypothetical protein BGW36DRAFT_18924 [Talaromyces proteolyticus]
MARDNAYYCLHLDVWLYWRRKVKYDRQKPSCSFGIKNGTVSLFQYADYRKEHGVESRYVSQLKNKLELLEAEVRELKSLATKNVQFEQSPFTPSLSSNANEAIHISSDLSATLSAPPAMSVRTEHDGTRCPSRSTYAELCTAWFYKVHAWFPILHLPTVIQTLQDTSIYIDLSPIFIVRKAIAAVALSHVGFPTSLSFDQRRIL